MCALTSPHRLSATRATLIAIVCSFFEMFDVPVYWPILVVYFFVLFLLTMRRQIQCVIPCLRIVRHTLTLRTRRHMIKYKYVPFDIGRKVRYGGAGHR